MKTLLVLVDAIAGVAKLDSVPGVLVEQERLAGGTKTQCRVRIVVCEPDAKGKLRVETFHTAVDPDAGDWQQDVADAFGAWVLSLKGDGESPKVGSSE